MDPRLLRYYNRELQFVREMGGEFARQFPKVAGRLGMDGFEVADPYVERLLEGFAFLAARVQLKLDDEFPKFTHHLLDMVYPHYLAPTPSMAVVKLNPSLQEGALAAGYTVPRGTSLRSQIGRDEQTACEYRTAHATTLWPLELTRAEYRAAVTDAADLRLLGARRPAAALHIRLRATAGVRFDQLKLERLPFFIRGDSEATTRLYESMLARCLAVVARPARRTDAWREVITDAPIRPMGFDDDQALLPYGPRSFHGYRLLQEYFAFPQRFLFVEFNGLGPAVQRCADDEMELVVLFSAADPALEAAVNNDTLSLFCTPAINLFPRRADWIHLSDNQHEYHVVPDRTRPQDLEVHSILEVVGHGTESRRRFLPFYGWSPDQPDLASFYSQRRERRRLSDRQRTRGARSNYVGSETFITLVDGDEGPFQSDLKQLSLETLCTNRDLPMHIPLGQGRTDFTLESGAPIESVRCVAGPTPPRASHAHGDTAWQIISHLSLNYLSLADLPGGQGASALRELLGLYADTGDASIRQEIASVVSVQSRPIVRSMMTGGQFAFVRGLEVTVQCDEAGFAGASAFVMTSVLSRFFERYVSINSFTETLLRTVQRGEVMRWPARIGQTPVL